MTDLTPLQQTQVKLGLDRPLAHAVLFAHRRPNKTPAFHRRLILDWHDPASSYLDMVFRGGAKSTIAEEAIVIKALNREFKNCLIVGADFDRAAARLHAIRMEFENNELIRQIYGDLIGFPWGEDRLVTSTGINIQALGRGQSLRGIKFLDTRPDLMFADDLEDYADVIKPEGRKKIHDWFDGELLPSLEPGYMARMAATPLHPEALPYHVMQDPSWKVHRFPIKYQDETTGEWQSSWPDRFPLTEAQATILRRTNPKVESIEKIEGGLVRKGQIHLFQCEYMCQAESPETKAFKAEMFRVEPQVRSYQAVYSMLDPARTVGAKSATTGSAVWSWSKGKLLIWDGWARRMMPDEIVTSLFTTYDEHHPVWMGFEEDGLNQWGLQPIRQEMARRGQSLPLKAVKAPPGKFDFIRGLQPFFHAREVVFAKELPELKQQLLGFPTGEIDAPNALAYALKMRPGAPIYADFGGRHVAEDIEPLQGRPVWLCLNATRSSVSGCAVQVFDGAIRLYADAVREGDPAQVLPGLISDMQADLGRELRLTAGPLHFDRYNNVGLVAAASKLPMRVTPGLPPERGRSRIVDMLQREKSSMPMLMVSSRALWTLNAFTGGYSRVLLKQGQLADYAEEGAYRTLMEGLESYIGLMELGSTDDLGQARLNALSPNGRAYRSIIDSSTAPLPSKDNW